MKRTAQRGGVGRKRAEKKPRDSEAHLRAPDERSADSYSYWEQDADHRFLRIARHDNSDIDRSPMIGKTRWETSAEPLEGTWEEHRRVLDARQPFYDFEMRLVDKNGVEHFITTTGIAIFDPAGVFIGYRGVARRITSRKRAEQLLRLEHAVARCVMEADGVSAALKAVIRTICETLGWDCGRFFHADDEAGVLRFSEFWTRPGPQFDRYIERSRLLTYARGTGLAGSVWQSGEPIWIADITRDPRASQRGIAAEAGMRGALVFPVISEEKALGVLTFSSREIREPDEYLLQAISVIGSQIGEFARRKRAEEVLRESEERFRSLTELSSDWYWEQDEYFRFTKVSDSLQRRIGQRPNSVVGKARWELPTLNMTDADWAAHRAQLEAHQPFRDLEWQRLDGDGKLHIASISGEPIFDVEGRFRGYRGIGRDVTQSKQSEEALRKSNERFDMAVRATSDVIRDWNLVTDKLWWNENFSKVFGYPETISELKIKSWYESIHVDDQGRVIAGVHRLIDAGGENWREEYRFRRADGSYAHVLDRGHVIRDGAGRAVRMIGAMADITSRKQAEERIHTQALQQRMIAEFGQQAFASADVEDVLSRAVELVSVTLKADYCNVLELEPDGKQLVNKAAAGWSGEFRGSRAVLVRPGSRVDFVLSRREPLVIEDLSQDPRYPDSPLLQLGVRSGIQVPIFGTARTFGILSAHAREPRHFSEEDVSFLQSVANTLAVAIERKSAEDRLAYLAQFDLLTGLPNRHLFHDRLLQTMANARRSGHPMAVLFVDLDHFKLVNDTQGHSAGDKLLKEAAARLTQCVRSGDTVGRFGGDEFGAIAADLSKPGDAGTVAQKVLDALAQPFRLDAHETYVSASIGITLFPTDGDDPETLVMNADTAMYRAKDQGRNTYQYFTREMNERALARVQTDAALRRAIERKEFIILYQPKVDLNSRLICGFEALLRWRHPERGLVLPGEFVSVLEEAGLIVQVGEWVLREVCAQIRTWQRAALAVKPVTVNLSARQFQQKDFEAIVRHILREANVDPGLVQFELTESLLMRDPEGAARTLRGLKDSGVKISVDDFGTGYSSLSYLKRFPIDALKIDRSFVRDISSDPDDAAIAFAIIGLAHSLKLRVVAEGVETREQLALLASNGCDEIQGFLFSVPETPEECAKMLRENRRLE